MEWRRSQFRDLFTLPIDSAFRALLTMDRIADSQYLRMIPCVRINDSGARECQEYCIDNPRMKCRRGARRYTVKVCIRVRMHIAIDISVFCYFHIFTEAIAKHAAYRLRMVTRNFDKRILITDGILANYLRNANG